MPVIADLQSEPEDDEPKSKLEKLIEAAKALSNSEYASINKMQSIMAAQEKMLRAAFGPRLMYDTLAEEASRIGRIMQGVDSSSLYIEKATTQLNETVASRALRASIEMPRIDRIMGDAASLSSSLRYFEKNISQVSHLAASVGRVAAQDYSHGVYKSFLDSQFSVRSQIETCKKTLESSFPNLLINQGILAKEISAIQKATYAGIPRDFFREDYSNVIQAISENVFSTQGLMFESVCRVLENKSLAFSAVAQIASLANQDALKGVLSSAQAIFDNRHFALEADFMQKAIAPFVRQWAWLVCDVRLVSVDIYHDKAPLMYAEYDRDTVIELLTARFALDATESDVSISSSGNLEDPNDLFECSGEHDCHHAHYDGETVLDSKDRSSTNKALSQYLDEARKNDVFDEDEWDQIKTDARRAEMFVRENYADMMHIAISYLMELSVLWVKETPISAEEYRARQEKALSVLRKLLPKPDEGRPQGSGLFKNKEDFLIALKDVLEKAHKQPSQIVALHALRQHPLCQRQTKDRPTQNKTKTLRNWLEKCGMTYQDALKRYWKPAQKGK